MGEAPRRDATEGGAARCPVCFTELVPGAERCSQCGRVQGEADRCPECGAVAGVERSSDGSLRCAACGRPREPVAGLTIRGERADLGPGGLRRPRGVAVRGLVGLLKAAGVGLGLLGLAATALVGLFVDEGQGLLWAVGASVSLLLLGAGWGLGALVDRWSLDREGERRRRLLEEAAAREGGRLTAARAAELLEVSEREADALLTSWVDGDRVRVHLDEERGTISYAFDSVAEERFRGRLDEGRPRVRVAEGDRPGASEADEVEEGEASEPRAPAEAFAARNDAETD